MKRYKDILLVVLYNENEKTSTTLSSFNLNCSKFFDDLKLVIWDNSSTQMIHSKSIKSLDVECEYFHTPENISLSKIYNRVIKNNLYSDSIFIFDQDSELTEEYFEKMLIAKNTNPNLNLFIPKILNDKTILSPAKRFLHKGIYVHKSTIKGEISSNKFIGIMSGMCIRIKLFREGKLSFDENLKLYGIDTKFSIDFSKVNSTLYVIDYILKHNLSMFADEDPVVKCMRFNSHISSMLYISKSISLWSYLSCILAILRIKLIRR